MPKIEARAPDPKTAAEVHRCSVNTAVFLAAFSSPVLGDVPVGRPFPTGRPRAKPAPLVRRIADVTMPWTAYRRLRVLVRLACAGPRSQGGASRLARTGCGRGGGVAPDNGAVARTRVARGAGRAAMRARLSSSQWPRFFAPPSDRGVVFLTSKSRTQKFNRQVSYTWRVR